MVERGADHLKALCVVAAALADRAWAVMNRQMPYVICDVTGEPVTPEQAKRIIAQHFHRRQGRRRRHRSGQTQVGTRPSSDPGRRPHSSMTVTQT